MYRYYVKADHPNLARPDKIFSSSILAADLACALARTGFENVRIEVTYQDGNKANNGDANAHS